MIRIFDKAEWQIDNGIAPEIVLKHFNNIFNWLNENNYLSKDGKEILEIGIDSSISLNEKMVISEGADFLEKYYDKFIEKSQYDTKLETYILDIYHEEYLSRK